MDTKLIHIHVPKCAGTSINALMAHRFGEACLAYSDPAQFARFGDLSMRERDARYSAVFGHLFYGLHEMFGADCTYFSVLRDPLERVCSYFNYVHLTPDHPEHRLFRTRFRSMDDFTLDRVRELPCLVENMSNYMTWAYSGITCRTPDEWARASARVDRLVDGGTLVLGDVREILAKLRLWGVVDDDEPLPRRNATAEKLHAGVDFELASASGIGRDAYDTFCALNVFDIRLFERYASRSDGRPGDTAGQRPVSHQNTQRS